MFKTSEVPINVLEIQFQFWEYQNVLDMVQKVIFSSEKDFGPFGHLQNEIAFTKHQLVIQKFRS